MPESFGIVFAVTRAARVQGFPYLLLFEHPGKWRARFAYE